MRRRAAAARAARGRTNRAAVTARRPNLTPEERLFALAAAEMGYKRKQIAAALDCSIHTLADVIPQERDGIRIRLGEAAR